MFQFRRAIPLSYFRSVPWEKEIGHVWRLDELVKLILRTHEIEVVVMQVHQFKSGAISLTHNLNIELSLLSSSVEILLFRGKRYVSRLFC